MILHLGKNLKKSSHNGISEYVHQHAYPSPQVAPNLNLLLDPESQIDNEKSRDDCPVGRFTGGRVCDKIVWLESTDIHVGINNMTGYDFPNRLFHLRKVNVD